MMEYKIPNKVEGFLRHFNGDRMNTMLVHTGTGQVVHVTKEYANVCWHKPVVSIAIADDESPQKFIKASFDTKEKLDMLIKILENQKRNFDE